MGVQNAKEFYNYIQNQEISESEERNIENIIKAFSEYLVAVNPDYLYNKTYMSAFVGEFIACQKALKRKREILLNSIVCKVFEPGIDVKTVIIRIDGAWIYRNGKLELSSTFRPHKVQNKKMQIELEYKGDNEFVVTEEIDIDKDYDKEIASCVSVFIERWRELSDE